MKAGRVHRMRERDRRARGGGFLPSSRAGPDRVARAKEGVMLALGTSEGMLWIEARHRGAKDRSGNGRESAVVVRGRWLIKRHPELSPMLPESW